MAAIVTSNNKPLSASPLKLSAPLGAAMAFMGIEGCMPLFHGSQGCTAFALVMLVRHFREAIPLQTTAMNEVSTILGGILHGLSTTPSWEAKHQRVALPKLTLCGGKR